MTSTSSGLPSALERSNPRLSILAQHVTLAADEETFPSAVPIEANELSLAAEGYIMTQGAAAWLTLPVGVSPNYSMSLVDRAHAYLNPSPSSQRQPLLFNNTALSSHPGAVILSPLHYPQSADSNESQNSLTCRVSAIPYIQGDLAAFSLRRDSTAISDYGSQPAARYTAADHYAHLFADTGKEPTVTLRLARLMPYPSGSLCKQINMERHVNGSGASQWLAEDGSGDWPIGHTSDAVLVIGDYEFSLDGGVGDITLYGRLRATHLAKVSE